MNLLRFYLLFSLLVFSTFVNAQWQNLSAPFGGSVLQFEEDGSDLYALTYGGIFKSANAGANWSLLGDTRHLGWQAVQLEVSAGTLYVLTQTGTVERSTDGGMTWKTVLAKPYPINGPGEKLLHIFASGDTVLVGSVLTIYRSVNQGNTWEKTFDNYAERYQGFAKVGSDIFAAHDWLIRKSSDGGLTWQQIFSAGYIFADFTAVDTILYALYDGYPRLIRSHDRGTTWDAINADSIEFYQYHDETRDWLTGYGQDIFYASDYWCIHGGIVMFQSPDGGDEWFTAAQQGLRSHWLRDLKALPSQLLAGTLQGIFRSTDKGGSFSPYHEDMNATWVQHLLKIGGSRWWTVTRQGVFSSDDESATWQLRFPGELEEPCWPIEKPLVATSKRIFYQKTTDCSIVFSEDNGDTWHPLSLFQFWECPQLAASESALWYVLDKKVFKLEDEQTIPVEVDFPSAGMGFSWEIKIENGVILIANSTYRYVSFDEGETWNALPPLLVDSVDFGGYLISLDEETIIYRVPVNHFISETQLFMLKFAENIWNPYSAIDAVTGDTISNLNDSWDIMFFRNENDIRWMGVRHRGLYYSIDEDIERWYPFQPELPFSYPTAMQLDGKNLWIGTAGAGIYKTQLDVLPPGQNGPTFSLFPNPSASETNLVCDVFFSENMNLRIFDAAGRLVHDDQLLPGNRWTGHFASLPSAVYFWQIQTSYGTTVLKWVKAR